MSKVGPEALDAYPVLSHFHRYNISPGSVRARCNNKVIICYVCKSNPLTDFYVGYRYWFSNNVLEFLETAADVFVLMGWGPLTSVLWSCGVRRALVLEVLPNFSCWMSLSGCAHIPSHDLLLT